MMAYSSNNIRYSLPLLLYPLPPQSSCCVCVGGALLLSSETAALLLREEEDGAIRLVGLLHFRQQLQNDIMSK